MPLKTVLDHVGVKPRGPRIRLLRRRSRRRRRGFRGTISKVDQQFGRSLSREKALARSPSGLGIEWRAADTPPGLAAPAARSGVVRRGKRQMARQIHVQEDQYLGKYQARWYRTLKGEMIDGEMKWNESAITHMQLKSFIARVTRDGNRHKVLGVVLNDGTPLKSVEVRVDNGPWQPATLDPATNGKYSWKLFTYIWNGATPGEHTLVSRVTDVTGKVQPTRKTWPTRKPSWRTIPSTLAS